MEAGEIRNEATADCEAEDTLLGGGSRDRTDDAAESASAMEHQAF